MGLTRDLTDANCGHFVLKWDLRCNWLEIRTLGAPSNLGGCKWWAVQDLNLRPSVCKTDALPLS
jgi:hypothetical protein